MLRPDSRLLYLDALRPPQGYTFDHGIGTTFSLDLLSLLFAPLSLALNETRVDKNLHDPIVILEALKRTADKLTVFCQRGRISIPKKHSLLYSYLEKMVIEVVPPQGVFHPKTWLLRYTKENESVTYRFVCLSRNLTFDQSWDTILLLEGKVGRRRVAKNRPLVNFVEALYTFENHGTNDTVKPIDDLYDEIMRIQFELPDGFDDYEFWPIGIGGRRKLPMKGEYSRLLTISPFLSDDLLKTLLSSGGEQLLISRQESLDVINGNILSQYKQIMVLDDAASKADLATERLIEDEAEEVDHESSGDKHELSGLHAKVYIAEKGWDAQIYTGSANATNAAFFKNVEFVVELSGKKSKVGIDCFLGKEGMKDTFSSLLTSYDPPQEVSEPTVIKVLEDKLENYRRIIASLPLRLCVTPNNNSSYDMSLLLEGPGSAGASDIESIIWPITLQEDAKHNMNVLLADGKILFRGLSAVALTAFIGIRLTAKIGTKKLSVNFVLKIQIEGLPEEREDMILREIISDQGKFLHYLFLLLHEDSGQTGSMIEIMNRFAGIADQKDSLSSVPLLEELVRAYSRAPEKLRRVEKLIEELAKDEKGRDILPNGFLETWQIIRLAMEERDDGKPQS